MTRASALIDFAQPTGPSTLEYSIPSAAVWNISMPSLAGVVIDPAHLMTSMSRFYTLAAEGSFDELSIPEMSSTQRQTAPERDGADGNQDRLPEQLGDRHGRRRAAPPGGRARSRISIGRSASAEFEFEIEKAEADRIDIGAFAHIFDASAYRDGRGDNIWRPVLSRVVYGKMTGTRRRRRDLRAG